METRDIIYPDFIGLYKVCSDGSIYSVRNNKFLKPATKPAPYDYKVIVLSNKPFQKAFNLHKVIADHFLVKPPQTYSNYEVNHIDMNKANNDVSNLEYVTHSQNMIKARKEKTWKSSRPIGFKMSSDTKKLMAKAKFKKCMYYNDNEKHICESIEELITKLGTYRKAFNRYVGSYKTLNGFYIRLIK